MSICGLNSIVLIANHGKIYCQYQLVVHIVCVQLFPFRFWRNGVLMSPNHLFIWTLEPKSGS